jgi:hypothetical protein
MGTVTEAVPAGHAWVDASSWDPPSVATPISPDLVLVLPEDERLRAIAELPAFAPFAPERAAPLVSAAEAPRPPSIARLAARYALERTIAVTVWYIGIALAIAVLAAVLAGR